MDIELVLLGGGFAALLLLLVGGLITCYFLSIRAMWRAGARPPPTHPEIT